MSDYAKVLEEYTRLLIAGPRSLDELSKMGRRLSLLKAGSREKPIEIHATEEEDLKWDLKNLEEDSEEDPEMLEEHVEEPVSEDAVLPNEKVNQEIDLENDDNSDMTLDALFDEELKQMTWEYVNGIRDTLPFKKGDPLPKWFTSEEDYHNERKEMLKINEENVAQEEDSLIEDSPESFSYFETFGNKKRKRNIVRKRPLRPRSCKKEKDFPFASRMVCKPVRLELDESEVEFVPQRLRTELRRLA